MSVTEAQLESRRIAGEALAKLKGQIEKSHDFYQVRSSTGDKFYKVTPRDEGWFCSCPDFTIRGVPACKHIFAVQFSLKIRETVRAAGSNYRAIQRFKMPLLRF